MSKQNLTSCLHCGGIILAPHLRGPTRKYCSDGCRRKADAAKKRTRQQETGGRGCEQCGKRLNRLQEMTGRRFCSHECHHLSQRSLKGTTRRCRVCGSAFEPCQKEQQCCSLACCKIAAGETRKQLLKETSEIACERCGSTITSIHYNGPVRHKYCARCQREVESERSRQRRLATSQIVEEIVDYEVFERDGWICQICGESVDLVLRWPDRMSASIDHIIPITKGGIHSNENVQLAHLSCNSRKGKRVEAGTCS